MTQVQPETFGQTCWASALHGPATCLFDFDLQCAGTSKWPCRPIMLRFGWTAESLCRCLPRLKRCFAAAWPVKGGQVLWFHTGQGGSLNVHNLNKIMEAPANLPRPRMITDGQIVGFVVGVSKLSALWAKEWCSYWPPLSSNIREVWVDCQMTDTSQYKVYCRLSATMRWYIIMVVFFGTPGFWSIDQRERERERNYSFSICLMQDDQFPFSLVSRCYLSIKFNINSILWCLWFTAAILILILWCVIICNPWHLVLTHCCFNFNTETSEFTSRHPRCSLMAGCKLCIWRDPILVSNISSGVQ